VKRLYSPWRSQYIATFSKPKKAGLGRELWSLETKTPEFRGSGVVAIPCVYFTTTSRNRWDCSLVTGVKYGMCVGWGMLWDLNSGEKFSFATFLLQEKSRTTLMNGGVYANRGSINESTGLPLNQSII